MKLTNPFPSYSQYNEDIVIAALLFDVEKGFYVDVGANHPVNDSVTKLFYENGWRGINIEPIPSIYKILSTDRTEDLNLNIGIGNIEDEISFYQNIDMPGHSSFDRKSAMGVDKNKIKRIKIKVDKLSNVLSKFNTKHIHFLKIDVEGYEFQVIEGIDWELHRPEVICIEYNGQVHDWKNKLLNHGYSLFISDGLNEFYIAEESLHRIVGFQERVVSISHKSMKQHHYQQYVKDTKQLLELTRLNKVHYDMLQKMKFENRLTLANVSFLKRIKRIAVGITIDWLRYRFNK